MALLTVNGRLGRWQDKDISILEQDKDIFSSFEGDKEIWEIRTILTYFPCKKDYVEMLDKEVFDRIGKNSEQVNQLLKITLNFSVVKLQRN